MKFTRWLILFLLLAALILAGCGTQEATPVEEVSEAPQEEAAPTDVPMAEEEEDTGNKIEEIFEVSLLNAEAMVDNLGNYLLRPTDLPNEYKIPEAGEQRLATIRLIQDMGEVEAKTYVKETGRIDGWWLELQRVNKSDFAPVTFESSIQLFETINGAQTAMSPDYYLLDEAREYTPVAGGCDLGDQCEFYYSVKEDPATELLIGQYNLAFTYKNAFVWLLARGFEFDLDAGYVRDAAGAILTKLESAPTK